MVSQGEEMVAEHSPVTVLERIRQLEDEIIEHWRSLGAFEQGPQQQRLAVVEVEVARRRYLLPIKAVLEVVAMPWPEPLADAPDWVLGTMPFGSKTVPLVDLGMRLEGARSKVVPELFVVIVQDPRWLGLVVAGVGKVVEVEVSAISSPAPQIPHASFFLGVTQNEQGDPVYLLSVERLSHELGD